MDDVGYRGRRVANGGGRRARRFVAGGERNDRFAADAFDLPACQPAVALAPPAGLWKNVVPLIEVRIIPPSPTATTVPPAKATS